MFFFYVLFLQDYFVIRFIPHSVILAITLTIPSPWSVSSWGQLVPFVLYAGGEKSRRNVLSCVLTCMCLFLEIWINYGGRPFLFLFFIFALIPSLFHLVTHFFLLIYVILLYFSFLIICYISKFNLWNIYRRVASPWVGFGLGFGSG